jgi:hypothetical protein
MDRDLVAGNGLPRQERLGILGEPGWTITEDCSARVCCTTPFTARTCLKSLGCWQWRAGPSSTWTYLISDNPFGDVLQRLLRGPKRSLEAQAEDDE